MSTTIYLRKRPGGPWEHVSVAQTRNADVTRWTGPAPGRPARTIHVFGDSWMGGIGVYDEQTFAYLLQQALPDVRVRLYAVEGYGMTQVLLQVRALRGEIRDGDIVLLGYADWYDLRSVVAPSWLRTIDDWLKFRRMPLESFLWPAAALWEPSLEIRYVQQNCELNDGYCGRADNPIFALLGREVVRISALPSDFPTRIRDNVAGFAPHPGPYWHHAISRRLAGLFAPAAAAAK